MLFKQSSRCSLRASFHMGAVLDVMSSYLLHDPCLNSYVQQIYEQSHQCFTVNSRCTSGNSIHVFAPHVATESRGSAALLHYTTTDGLFSFFIFHICSEAAYKTM